MAVMTSKELMSTMPNRIDAVAGSAPGHLLPVESSDASRRAAPEEQRALAPEPVPGASFTSQPADDPNAYVLPVDSPRGGSNFVESDPVAPALAEALAAEPWGHPMPEKAAWEKAAAIRQQMASNQPEAPVTVPAASPTPAAVGGESGPNSESAPVTPVATTAAAPATHAAAVAPGSAAPVSPAWLTSLLKAR
jgi:hypothetical protein